MIKPIIIMGAITMPTMDQLMPVFWTAACPLKGVTSVETLIPPDPKYEKLPLEIAVPPGAVTVITATVLLEPKFGTIAVISSSEITLKLCPASFAPNCTAVAPVNPLPKIVIAMPGAPDVGVKETIFGIPADVFEVKIGSCSEAV